MSLWKKIAESNGDHSTLKRHSMCNKRQFRERKYQVKPHIEIYIVHHLTHKNSLDIILCTTNHNNEFIMTYITLVKGAAHQFYFFFCLFSFFRILHIWAGKVPLTPSVKSSSSPLKVWLPERAPQQRHRGQRLVDGQEGINIIMFLYLLLSLSLLYLSFISLSLSLSLLNNGT